VSAVEWRYTPLALVRQAPGAAERELDAFDASPSWFGGQPDEPRDYRRFEVLNGYLYPIRRGDGSHLGDVEFRAFVYWVGPAPRSLEDNIISTVQPRLRTLFNSGPYLDYMRGFNFADSFTNIERSAETAVGRDEASNLGVVQWEVLVKDENGEVQGTAYGFADPWRLIERAPEHEVYEVTRNDARNAYEIRPQGRARVRLLGSRKQVTLNGRYIGNTVPTRGTVWLKQAYGTADGTYKDSASGRQMWSRRKLIDDHGLTYQSIVDGGQVYKVNETSDVINLVATRSTAEENFEFDPTAPDEIPADVADESTELQLDEEAVGFLVREDTGPKLGKYDDNTVRRITDPTNFPIF